MPHPFDWDQPIAVAHPRLNYDIAHESYWNWAAEQFDLYGQRLLILCPDGGVMLRGALRAGLDAWGACELEYLNQLGRRDWPELRGRLFTRSPGKLLGCEPAFFQQTHIVDVLSAWSESERQAAWAEQRRVLEPNGQLVLVRPQQEVRHFMTNPPEDFVPGPRRTLRNVPDECLGYNWHDFRLKPPTPAPPEPTDPNRAPSGVLSAAGPPAPRGGKRSPARSRKGR